MSNKLSLIRSANIDNGLVRLGWDDGNSSVFHSIWLRDNCRCTDCGDPAIGYRKSRLSGLDLDCKPGSLDTDSSSLTIIWQDGHDSCFTAQWLREHDHDNHLRQSRAFKPKLWDDDFRHNPPTYEYADINASESRLLDMLQQVRDYGLCFIRNAPPKPGIAEPLARRFGFPQESNFGKVQDLLFDPGKRSIADRLDQPRDARPLMKGAYGSPPDWNNK